MLDYHAEAVMDASNVNKKVAEGSLVISESFTKHPANLASNSLLEVKVKIEKNSDNVTINFEDETDNFSGPDDWFGGGSLRDDVIELSKVKKPSTRIPSNVSNCCVVNEARNPLTAEPSNLPLDREVEFTEELTQQTIARVKSIIEKDHATFEERQRIHSCLSKLFGGDGNLAKIVRHLILLEELQKMHNAPIKDSKVEVSAQPTQIPNQKLVTAVEKQPKSTEKRIKTLKKGKKNSHELESLHQYNADMYYKKDLEQLYMHPRTSRKNYAYSAQSSDDDAVPGNNQIHRIKRKKTSLLAVSSNIKAKKTKIDSNCHTSSLKVTKPVETSSHECTDAKLYVGKSLPVTKYQLADLYSCKMCPALQCSNREGLEKHLEDLHPHRTASISTEVKKTSENAQVHVLNFEQTSNDSKGAENPLRMYECIPPSQTNPYVIIHKI